MICKWGMVVVEASIRAWRLEPFPEMSTVIFVGGGLCILRVREGSMKCVCLLQRIAESCCSLSGFLLEILRSSRT